MNGEVGFACRLTAAAKNAIKGAGFSFTAMQYEKNTAFLFEKRGEEVGYRAESPEAWYEKLSELGVCNVFLMMPFSGVDRRTLGMVNSNGCTIFAQFNDGTTSRFMPRWAFNQEEKTWDITIYEELMQNAPASAPSFKNNANDFKKALGEIMKLADTLGFDQFAYGFARGYEILNGGAMPDNLDEMIVPKLDEDKLRMYLAADISDVFGAMGSWNDTPFVTARDKGLENEYHKLSEALLAQNRLALMYAVNS